MHELARTRIFHDRWYCFPRKKKKIDSDTAKNLISMLRSEDIDNFNIAVLAIEQLKK